MKIYKKKVKRHEEVWADVPDNGEGRVRVCVGNSNYGRLYVITGDEWDALGFYLDEEDTRKAFELFGEIWEKNKDNKPFKEA